MSTQDVTITLSPHRALELLVVLEQARVAIVKRIESPANSADLVNAREEFAVVNRLVSLVRGAS